ncbi:hypothetical protein HFO24_06725 [Rhizobium laguerreae]|uniref:hypothetical protein n=1 Tax=Rhizobium laguerreae TaxID=1076926 RepID=UPI001C90026D|nr:hypothetical protein [Rhizobium laguerreae]MBY3181364.1 hypothetical protein [Rhizobium laguerreae]
MGIAEQFPEIKPFLDTTDDYVNEGRELVSGGKKYLIVTQKGEIDSGQLLFEMTDQGLVHKDTDTTVTVGPRLDTFSVTAALQCELSDPGDITAVFKKVLEAENVFSSASGPDGGNLACVWAVRHIARNALGRWITRTDGTAVFDPELRRCFSSTMSEADVGEGCIIISPTEGSNIGHVGILGPRTGDDSRLIYSNSSAAALWKQNFTLKSWVKRYKTTKGLKVHFFPIPNYVSGTV